MTARPCYTETGVCFGQLSSISELRGTLSLKKKINCETFQAQEKMGDNVRHT